MFFHLSKIGWFLLEPSNALVFILSIGVVLFAIGRLKRLARALVAAGLGGIIVCGFSPLGHWMILPLEDRFPPWRETDGPPDGIILLGGSFDTVVSLARQDVALTEAGERVSAFVALARRYPQARLVFTGGSAAILFEHTTEASLAEEIFASLGIDPARVEFEDHSRNTWENAVFTHDLVAPQQGERWLLVTSGWHMPRAMGCFRAAGFDVEAYPVDYRTRGTVDFWRPFFSLSEGLRRVDLAAHEWIGLLVYRATGRLAEALPGP